MKRILAALLIFSAFAAWPAFAAPDADHDADRAPSAFPVITPVSDDYWILTDTSNSGLLSKVATSGVRAAIGLGTTSNVTFGNVIASGGTLYAGVANTTQGALVLYTNTDPIYTAGLMPAASPSEIVAIKFPPAMPGGANYLFNVDADGTGGWTDPSTLGGAAEDTAYDVTSWNGDTDAPSKNVIRDYLYNFDADGDGSFTDEAWFPAGSGDDQTAAEVNITDAGSFYAGTTVEAALQEAGVPLKDSFTGTFLTGITTHKAAIQAIGTYIDNADEITAGTGITITDGAVSVTANTYLPYDADWSGITTAGGTFLATPSSANLRSLISDESGTGVLLFAGGNIGSATSDGAVDFGGATSFEVPNGTDVNVDAVGEISFDSDDFWLRVYDGTNQVTLGRRQEEIHVTVYKPNDLDDAQRDAFLVWSNESGASFVVTGWKAWSTSDNTDLNIEETTNSNGSNSTVDAVSITTDGTSLYYASDTSITAGTIENGNLLWLDFDDTDTPALVKITIYGYYNADVD
jgi:hypothetical protein